MLAAALDAGVPYIGLVASRRRGAGVLAELAEARPDLARIAPGRVHSPAGLDIGARTAAEIALSILAEVVATRLHSAAPKDACATWRRRPGKRTAASRHGAVASTAVDPVCGMTVAAVETSLHLDHDGSAVLLLRAGLPAGVLGEPGRIRPSAPTHPASRVEPAAGCDRRGCGRVCTSRPVQRSV